MARFLQYPVETLSRAAKGFTMNFQVPTIDHFDAIARTTALTGRRTPVARPALQPRPEAVPQAEADDRLREELPTPPPPRLRTPAPGPGDLPLGGTATLEGGGWAVTFPGNRDLSTVAPADFHFDPMTVSPVSSKTALSPSTDLPRRTPDGEAALSAYLHEAPSRQSLVEGVDDRFRPKAAEVDLLD